MQTADEAAEGERAERLLIKALKRQNFNSRIGLSLLQRLQQQIEHVPVIIMTALAFGQADAADARIKVYMTAEMIFLYRTGVDPGPCVLNEASLILKLINILHWISVHLVELSLPSVARGKEVVSATVRAHATFTKPPRHSGRHNEASLRGLTSAHFVPAGTHTYQSSALPGSRMITQCGKDGRA